MNMADFANNLLAGIHNTKHELQPTPLDGPQEFLVANEPVEGEKYNEHDVQEYLNGFEE